LFHGKSSKNNLGYFEYFLKSDKNKKRPLGEKFAQSGHPAGGSM
jgi:hypothetical protein